MPSDDILVRVRPCNPVPTCRTRRFAQGDVVDVVAGPGPRTLGHRVLEISEDPLPNDFSHCAGCSARYRLAGLDPATDWHQGWRWDFELQAQSGLRAGFMASGFPGYPAQGGAS